MKTKLLALCIAMASASAIASDWTSGEFTGGIDIGGTIEKTEYPAKWKWKAGSSITDLNAFTKDLRNNGRQLTIQISENKPILLGKTAEAFFAHVTGVEAAPQITFKGFDQSEIEIQANGSPDGKHYLELPIKEASGVDKIGTLRINVTAAGVSAKEKDDTAADLSSLDATSAGEVFFGGLSTSSVIDSAATAVSKTSAFGSLGETELLSQLQIATNKNLVLEKGTAKKTETMADGKFTAATYAMAVEAGQTLVATFDSAVSSETAWKAPLSIEVSYQ